MDFFQRIIWSVLLAGFGLALAGCAPAGSSAADDEKEPHYILGQSRVNSMDFQGAVEAFEESLAANPRSAAAHFQLAMLYENERQINPPNPAASIYHYQQYLRFEPKAGNLEVVNQHIAACKQMLTADVMAMPSAPAAQKQIQQLMDTNRFLVLQLDICQRQLAALKTNAPQQNYTAPSSGQVVSRTQPSPQPTTPKTRTHMVVAGETPAGIARKYNVSLSALLAANPGLNPKKMRAGQTLNLPPL